jgi:serine/threonine protein kinase
LTIAELSAGTTIAEGSYKLVEVIASGGFSITYRALDLRSGAGYSTVVIKEHAYAGACYRDTATGDVLALRGREQLHRKLIERVLREAALLMTVRHPHVVHVGAAWEERGTAYYAMESLSGRTLQAEIEEASRGAWDDFRWNRVRILSLQLVDALQAIHDKSVYHCDVKPENVLLTPRGAILIDFGAARTEAQLSRTVTLMPFTAGYAAPELQNPETIRRVGPWTDVYAWGMLVYGLVTGHEETGYPLDALARLTRVQMHSAEMADPYEHAERKLVDKGLSEQWAKAVHACLRIDPGDRPQSMQALEKLLGEDASAVAGLPLPERTLQGCPAPVRTGASIRQPPEATRAADGETPQSMVITEIGPPPFTGPGVAALREPARPARVSRRPGWKAPALLLALFAIVPAGIAAALRMRPADVPSSQASANDHPEALLTADPPPSSPPAMPIPTCSEFQIRCGEFCAWATDPIFGCGTCKPCSLDHVSEARCEKQRCAPKACEPGWDNCDGLPKNGCETNLRRDIAHCGSCATSCGDKPHVAEPACGSGACRIKRCERGWKDCNGSFDDGCEVNVDSDPANCGDCKQSCGAGRNAAVECSGGSCALRCRAPWGDCDGTADSGCETDMSSHPLHCGACGKSCVAAHVSRAGCGGGACTIGACTAGWDDCDGNAVNGCECRERPPDVPPWDSSAWEGQSPGGEGVPEQEPQ